MDFKANIERMRKELVEMEAKLEQKSQKPYGWLQKGVEYYFVHNTGVDAFSIWTNDDIDTKLLAMGNVYQTRELVKQAIDRQLAKVRIINALREREGDWVANWSDFNQNKYYVHYDHDLKEVDVGNKIYCQDKESEMYSNYSACRWVVDNMESDVKLYLGVE